ncbi:MAG TPA: hypothetical protein P5137_16255, partial [Candidatus Brocadiia bacterium]|nr:hypothetical protein [Candidatus Brocadiia bacterium]
MRELRQDWRDLFLSFRIALDPKKMLLGMIWAFVAIFLLMLPVGLMASPDSALRQSLATAIRHPAGECVAVAKACVDVSSPMSLPERLAGRSQLCAGVKAWWETRGGWSYWQWLVRGFLLAVWFVVVVYAWALFGGPLLRLCALQVTRDEVASFREGWEFAAKKRLSMFCAPLAPVIFMVLIMLAVAVVGFLARIPWLGPLAVGVFFPVAIFAGLFFTLILIGWLFGGCMMGPTIMVEGTDAFDAISRSYSYVYQKPWRYIWYTLVGGAYGVVCIAFVALVAMLSIWAPLWVGGWAMGSDFGQVRQFLCAGEWPSSFPLAAAGVLIKFWSILAYGLVLGFAVSFALALGRLLLLLP